MRSSIANVLADLDHVFHSLGVGWYLFGAQAAILHGASRLTADIDVTVALGNRPYLELCSALENAAFASRVRNVEEFVSKTRVLPIKHLGTSIPVDVILAGPGLEELFLSRAMEINIEDINIHVARPEDMIAMKLLAGRPKDIDDAAAILFANTKKLDVNMIKKTLRQFEKALDRADLIPELTRLMSKTHL